MPAHYVPSSEKVRVDLGVLMNLHLLSSPSVSDGWLVVSSISEITHHLEAVQLLLDLLREHGRKPVACCNVSSAVVVMG